MPVLCSLLCVSHLPSQRPVLSSCHGLIVFRSATAQNQTANENRSQWPAVLHYAVSESVYQTVKHTLTQVQALNVCVMLIFFSRNDMFLDPKVIHNQLFLKGPRCKQGKCRAKLLLVVHGSLYDRWWWNRTGLLTLVCVCSVTRCD